MRVWKLFSAIVMGTLFSTGAMAYTCSDLGGMYVGGVGCTCDPGYVGGCTTDSFTAFANACYNTANPGVSSSNPGDYACRPCPAHNISGAIYVYGNDYTYGPGDCAILRSQAGVAYGNGTADVRVQCRYDTSSHAYNGCTGEVSHTMTSCNCGYYLSGSTTSGSCIRVANGRYDTTSGLSNDSKTCSSLGADPNAVSYGSDAGCGAAKCFANCKTSGSDSTGSYTLSGGKSYY